MRILKYLTTLALLLLFSFPAMAETITGSVVEDGSGSIRVGEVGGETLRIHTARGMKFEPNGYRPRAYDKVEVTYEMQKNRRTGNMVAIIKKVKMTEQAQRNKPIKSPVTGTIAEVGRKRFKVEVDDMGIVTFERTRGTPKVENAIEKPQAGQRVKVFSNRVPSRFGLGYVNLLHGFQRAE